MKKLFSTCLMAMAAVSSVFAAEWPFTVSPDPSVPITSALSEIILSIPEGSDTSFTSVNDKDAIYVTLDGENYKTTNSEVIDEETLYILVKGGGMDVPGNYEVVIGAGAISMNDTPTTEDIVINYTFEGNGAPSNEFLNPNYPQTNTVISQIDSFWIENKTGYNLTLENAEGIYLAVDFEKAYELELNVMDYGFEAYVIGADGYITEIKEPGEYQLIIEPRSLALVNPDDAEDINYIDDAIYFNYIVGTPEIDFSNFPLDFYPAPGSKVGTLEYIYIEPNQELGFTGINCLEEPSYVMGICNSDQDFFEFTAEYDDTYMRLTLNEPITVAGEYSLIIMPYSIAAYGEEEEFYIDELTTVPFTVVGEVANPYDVPFKVVEPSAAVVDAVYYVELDLDYESGYNEFVVNDYNGFYFTKDGNYYIPGSVEADGNVLYIDAIPYLTTSGEYALVIEKGAISWKNDKETVTSPEEYVFNITVDAGEAGEVPFTIDPESGSTVEFLSSFTLSFDPSYEVDIDPYSLYFIDTETYENAALIDIEEIDESTYLLTLVDEEGKPSPVTASGMYQLVFDSYGVICNGDNGGYYNESPLFFTYFVDPSIEYTLVPKVTVSEDFTKFTLKFEEGVGMGEAAFATYVNEEAEYSKYALFTDNGDSSFTVEFDEVPPTPGNYIFNVERGMFGDAEFIESDETSGIANEAISMVIDVTVTGIVSVSVENVKKGVYNLHGVKVAESTENLPAGIYVVDGKKVVVK